MLSNLVRRKVCLIVKPLLIIVRIKWGMLRLKLIDIKIEVFVHKMIVLSNNIRYLIEIDSILEGYCA